MTLVRKKHLSSRDMLISYMELKFTEFSIAKKAFTFDSRKSVTKVGLTAKGREQCKGGQWIVR